MRAFICFFIVNICSAQQYVTSTLAGGAPPPTPNPGRSVSFPAPYGIAVDSQGTVYFTSDECLFSLSPNGVLSRLAGNSRQGYTGDGGPAINAQLGDGGLNSGPGGSPAVDAQGNLYIADAQNRVVRKILPNGVITTVAGNFAALALGDGGPAVDASIGSPSAVVFDGAGNMYLADPTGGLVRKVTASGIISTVANLGRSPEELSSAQMGLAIDSLGNLYVSASTQYKIFKIAPSGAVSAIAGTGVKGFSGDGGPATQAQFNYPAGIAVDAIGNVYVADYLNLRIRRISTDGSIATVAGGGTTSPGDGVPATQALLKNPNGVAISADGSLYIAAGWIQKVAPSGTISILAGNGYQSYSGDNGPATSAQLFEPGDVAFDSMGNTYIADDGNNVIRRVDSSGIITTFGGTGVCAFGGDGGPATLASFCSPAGVAVDGAGDIFIADAGNNRVRMISPSGTTTTVAGNGAQGYPPNQASSGDGGPATQAPLSPAGVLVDGAGDLFIAESLNNRIRKVSKGTITTVAGTGVGSYSGDGGPATSAELFAPSALAMDAAGNLYVVDGGNERVRMISASGVISTVAGNGTPLYPGDGALAVNAGIFGPQGVAVDSAGNLFISAVLLGKIFMVSKSGIISTVTGYASTTIAGDGVPAATAYLGPALTGLRIDSAGRILVADGSTSVRILQPVSQSALIGAVVDAASESAIALSPGKIVVIYGTGLGPTTLVSNQPQNDAFSTQLAGTTVSMNGMPAPILYTSATQVAAITPYEITGATAQVQVTYQGAASQAVSVPIDASAPSLFSLNSSGAGQVAAVNADGSINDAAHPVQLGGYVSLYATGEGQTMPAGVDGKLAPLAPPFPQPQASVSVTVGGLPATVLYAGGAPGEVAGLMQVVVQIPTGVQAGGYVPVTLQVGGVSTVSGAAWIAVSN